MIAGDEFEIGVLRKAFQHRLGVEQEQLQRPDLVFKAEKMLLAGDFSSTQEMEEKHLKGFRETVATLEYEVEGKALRVDDAQAAVDELRSELDDTESELADLTSELSRVRDRIAALVWVDQSENYQRRSDPDYVLGALREHLDGGR